MFEGDSCGVSSYAGCGGWAGVWSAADFVPVGVEVGEFVARFTDEDGGVSVVAAAAAGAPGGASAELLAGLDPARLSDDGRLEVLAGLEKVASWVAAAQARVLAALGGPPTPAPLAAVMDDDFVRELVAAHMSWSGATAGGRLVVARALVERLPGTLAALEEGRIDARTASMIVDVAAGRDPAVAAGVEAAVLAKADGRTVAELRRVARRAVIAADPGGALVRHERAVAGRRVEVWPAADGMAEIRAVLSAQGAATVFGALDALARGRGPAGPGGGGVGIDARRADALVALCAAALSGGPLPGGPLSAQPSAGPLSGGRVPGGVGARPVVNVTVDVVTLLGLADEPAELAGYGPIPPGLARVLAADGVWRRLVTDPLTGHLLDAGRHTYRPSAALVDFVAARDRVCAFPGCNQPARRCDVDHVVPFAAGGRTTRANCGPLCRRHHRLKHKAGWGFTRRDDDGMRVWTSPTGRTYHKPPPTWPPDLDPGGPPDDQQIDLPTAKPPGHPHARE